MKMHAFLSKKIMIQSISGNTDLLTCNYSRTSGNSHILASSKAKTQQFSQSIYTEAVFRKIMDFNNPFLPFYNQGFNLNQTVNPMAPWNFPAGYPFLPMHYQPHMTIPFQQTPTMHSMNSLSPMMIHQQNNYYGSSFSSQALLQPAIAPVQKIATQKMTHNLAKQKKKGMLQNTSMRTQLVKPKKTRIAQIIQIKDSDEQQVLEKERKSRDQWLIQEKSRSKDPQKQEPKKYHNEQKLQSRKVLMRRKFVDPIFQEGKKQLLKQSQMPNSGRLRRSKRNSEQISKKIRKIINDEMGLGLAYARKMTKSTFKKEKVLQAEDQSNCSKTVKTCYLQRANLPHHITIQEHQKWKQCKVQQLLSRAFS